MQTLLLLRHAKSSWDDGDLSDHDRPLNRRGRLAAHRMGIYLRQHDLLPRLVLCSTAKRAVETLELLQEEWSKHPTTRFEEGLYLATAAELLGAIQALGSAPSPALLIGHNPGIGHFAVQLAGSGKETARDRMRRKYPTAGLAELRFDVGDWSRIEPGGGSLQRFVRPKELA